MPTDRFRMPAYVDQTLIRRFSLLVRHFECSSGAAHAYAYSDWSIYILKSRSLVLPRGTFGHFRMTGYTSSFSAGLFVGLIVSASNDVVMRAPFIPCGSGRVMDVSMPVDLCLTLRVAFRVPTRARGADRGPQ